MSQSKQIEVKIRGPKTVRIDGGSSLNIEGCKSPYNVRFTIDNINLLVRWDAVIGAQSYQFRLRQVGSNTWISPPVAVANIALFQPLQFGADYEFQIKTNCLSGGSSGWESYTFSVDDPNAVTPGFDYTLPVIFQQ